MVRGITTGNTIPEINLALNASSGRKLSLPVAPSSLIYSHFRNVAGEPAPEGSQGVTISKLNMLDVIIEQMNKVKKPDTVAPLRNNKIEAMLESYKKAHTEAKTASMAMPYTPHPQDPAGALLRIKI